MRLGTVPVTSCLGGASDDIGTDYGLDRRLLSVIVSRVVLKASSPRRSAATCDKRRDAIQGLDQVFIALPGIARSWLVIASTCSRKVWIEGSVTPSEQTRLLRTWATRVRKPCPSGVSSTSN